MNVLQASQREIWPRRAEYHVLTYAEEGFAPLNIHTRDSAISKDQLVKFAARINDHKEVGSLYPSVAVSAVPRSVVRDVQDAQVLRNHIEELFHANVQTIRAKKVLFDFRAPSVPQFVVTAIHDAIACRDAAFVEEVVVVNDAEF